MAVAPIVVMRHYIDSTLISRYFYLVLLHFVILFGLINTFKSNYLNDDFVTEQNKMSVLDLAKLIEILVSA